MTTMDTKGMDARDAVFEPDEKDAELARLLAENERLAAELAASRENHIDANKRNMQANERAAAAERDLAQARAELAALRAMLKDNEWSADTEMMGRQCCPSCGKPRCDRNGNLVGTHFDDCRLAALLPGASDNAAPADPKTDALVRDAVSKATAELRAELAAAHEKALGECAQIARKVALEANELGDVGNFRDGVKHGAHVISNAIVCLPAAPGAGEKGGAE